jgi:thiamine biosynthesis protein ThiS
MTLTVTVNGRAREVDAGTTLATVVESVTPVAQGVAVAVNDAVVPRRDWVRTVLAEADQVEILTAVQGG